MTDTAYNHAKIEKKWQEKWEADQLYRSVIDESRPKFYALTMLPYPSGDLHIGHWYAMTPSDARARFMRMNGYNVLFPMGFDAFGLPAENAAIKRGIHPKEWTYKNIGRMREQMKTMGAMFDWKREAVRLILNTIVGASGSSPSCTSTAWPTARCRPWTGAQTATPPCGANRFRAKTATASAAARPSSRKTWISGSSPRQNTPTNCWTSRTSTGPNASKPCKPTGLDAVKAHLWSSRWKRRQ